MQNVKISLIVPVYNEEELLKELVERTTRALGEITPDFEIICVDDGSTDRSAEILREAHQKEKRVKLLQLSRNFGHQAAYTAGLHYARGEFIAMMDGDLQDPPELIKEMYDKLASGKYDIVYGKRKERKEKGLRRIGFALFHFLFKNISDISMAYSAGNFSMLNRKSLNAFLSLPEKNRYLPGLRFFIGFRQGFVEYVREERKGGAPKMSLRKLYALAMDAMLSFSNIPIKISLYVGITGIIIFFIAGLYVLLSKFTGIAPFGWSSTLLSIYFLGSIQLLFLGILGEYVSRIYKETQNRPVFIVTEFIED